MKRNLIGYSLLFCVAWFGLCTSSSAMADNSGKLVEVCGNCHGKGGASAESDVPIIGGYSVDYLTERLNAYKNQETECPEVKFREGSKKGQKSDMCKIAHDLSAADIKQIAQYFSKQKFVRAKQKFDSSLAKKGKEIHEENCEKCHSEGGTVSKDDAGITGGQWMPFLVHAVQEFQNGKRPIAKKMKIKLDKMEKDDIDALINYYGSMK